MSGPTPPPEPPHLPPPLPPISENHNASNKRPLLTVIVGVLVIALCCGGPLLFVSILNGVTEDAKELARERMQEEGPIEVDSIRYYFEKTHPEWDADFRDERVESLDRFTIEHPLVNQSVEELLPDTPFNLSIDVVSQSEHHFTIEGEFSHGLGDTAQEVSIEIRFFNANGNFVWIEYLDYENVRPNMPIQFNRTITEVVIADFRVSSILISEI